MTISGGHLVPTTGIDQRHALHAWFDLQCDLPGANDWNRTSDLARMKRPL